MNKKKRIVRFCLVALLSTFCALSFVNSQKAFAASALKVKDGCWAQGATIMKKSFVYIEWCGNDKDSTIYSCDRSNTKISNCKKIITGVFNHANAIDSEWGSDYFRVLDNGDPAKKDHPHWCVSVSKKTIVDDSYCGGLPEYRLIKKVGSKTSKYGQDYTQYGEYYVRGYAFKNRIDIYKGDKLVKSFWVGHDDEELEGVGIDGDTGVIYFTTASNTQGRQIKLYKVSPSVYKMPKYSELEKNKSKNDNSKNNTSNSGKTNSSSTDTTKNKSNSTSSTNDANSSTSGSISNNSDKCSGNMPAPVASVMGCNSNTDTEPAKDFSSTVVGIVNGIVGVLGLVAVIFIIVGGVQYMTSAGDAGKLEKAKKTILYAVIGLIICALAFAIVNFVVGILK